MQQQSIQEPSIQILLSGLEKAVHDAAFVRDEDIQALKRILSVAGARRSRITRQNRVQVLLQSLDHRRKDIEEYSTLSVEIAVQCRWQDDDIRINHTRLGDQKCDISEEFLRALADRSLAVEFDDWQHRSKAIEVTQLKKLVNPDQSCSTRSFKHGSIPEFLREKIGILQDNQMKAVQKGIRGGLRSVALEKMVGTKGVSAALAFACHQLRNLKPDDIVQAAAGMQHSWVHSFAQCHEDWFCKSFERYEHERKQRKLSLSRAEKAMHQRAQLDHGSVTYPAQGHAALEVPIENSADLEFDDIQQTCVQVSASAAPLQRNWQLAPGVGDPSVPGQSGRPVTQNDSDVQSEAYAEAIPGLGDRGQGSATGNVTVDSSCYFYDVNNDYWDFVPPNTVHVG